MDETAAKRIKGAGVAYILVFLSGFAALIYQVLWMKQIGLLFGNTSHAASATLASFFAGLATGSWVLGRRVSTSANPMLTYAWLEAAIALTALLYFIILALYHAIYPAIYQSLGNGGLLLFVKFGLSMLLVFPPAFCMGGTIPVLGQYMIRERSAFGNTAAMMYGINTLGAAIGAGLAGFYLPLWIGFNATCGLAVIVSAGVSAVAIRLSRNPGSVCFEVEGTGSDAKGTEIQLSRQVRRRLERDQKRGRSSGQAEAAVSSDTRSPRSRHVILFLCFLSGFGILALEVLWTRLFSQVLENSVYTFAAILVVVLVCLALGALASSRLARLNAPPFLVLTALVIAGGAAVAATPTIFLSLTDGMKVVSSAGSWSSYILLIFRTAALTIAPSALLLGMIFPYLMKLEELHLKSPGISLGKLATANTVGAILGALLCGFLLLDWLGIWRSMQLVAAVYLVASLFLPIGWDMKSMAAKVVGAGTLLLTLIAVDPGKLPITSIDPDARPETVIETWEGSDCTVSVTEGHLGTAIRINSHYSLGSTGAYMQEKFQADLPLMVFPKSEDVFFLGVGTGITAGAALDPRHVSVEKVIACELVPEVITAAKKYMTDVKIGDYPPFDTTTGLFTDPRATVLIEDGRHHLMATNEKYDIINSDLFVPFRSGAGSLYSREHFESAKKRLKPGGVFVQWLPLYQLTEYEFSIIARTMIASFDQVSMWRHNFQPSDEVVALIGHQSGRALPASDIDSSEDKLYAVAGKTHRDLQYLNLPLDPQTILLFYAGNLTEARSLFDSYPINTDDKPVIEYMAPRTYRSKADGKTPWFTGEKFAEMVGKIQGLCPPDADPLLKNRTAENQRLPLAGQAYHRARIAEVKGDQQSSAEAWQEFVTEWTDR